MFKNTATTSTLTIIFILNHFYGYCTPDLYDGDACQLKDGSLGVCKSLVLCRWVNEGLRRGSIKTSDLVRCSFEGTNEITCCKDEIPTPSQRPIPSGDEDIYFGNNDISIIPNPTSPSSTSPPPPRLGQRRSEIACENYTRLSSAFLSFNILGGSPTALGEFPHMAALGFPTQEFGGNEYDFNCGGSVISEVLMSYIRMIELFTTTPFHFQNFILTAAHCVTDRNLPTIVRTGKITLLTNDDGVEGVTSTIAEIISHPNYTPSRRYDDIALIRLANPIPFDDHIRPACLRSNMSDIGADVQLIVTGWGRTSVEFGQRSNALLKTNLTGVSLASCNSSLLDYNANDRSLRNGVNLGQICANDPQGGHDSCEGDSGGPLQIYSENGMSTIVGVTSFGISCGSALPSVYARVAFYLDWIESIVWPSR
ncbi:Serine protease persephone [Pseudolycoriella hygida]|uniref:Serine protease persephone n=1 Tax=Pseudolycoriella hygida TaxID=35572 RepID=A0A9Q0MVH6_9DIPT|nr:Serine protease persephone [Pseudolycoriella hygida]